jgi:hypothetical protein
MQERPDWGILYFAYDWFSAIRTDLVKKVPGSKQSVLAPCILHRMT